MDRLSNNEIFKKLQNAGEISGVSVTYKTQIAYVKLLDKALEDGNMTEDGASLTLTVTELAEYTGISSRFMETALKSLSQCGVIARNKVGKTVTTIFVSSFYEGQKGDNACGNTF